MLQISKIEFTGVVENQQSSSDWKSWVNKSTICVVIHNSSFKTKNAMKAIKNQAFKWQTELTPLSDRQRHNQVAEPKKENSLYLRLCNKCLCRFSCPGSGRLGPVPPKVQQALFSPADPPLPAVHQPHLWKDQGLLRQPDSLVEMPGALALTVLPVKKLKAFFNKEQTRTHALTHAVSQTRVSAA